MERSLVNGWDGTAPEVERPPPVWLAVVVERLQRDLRCLGVVSSWENVRHQSKEQPSLKSSLQLGQGHKTMGFYQLVIAHQDHTEAWEEKYWELCHMGSESNRTTTSG